MYLSNKYTRWYNQIISNATNRGSPNTYFEIHHIIPKSLGGTNQKSNLVKLTAREHFICHRLLTKMVTGEQQIKMIYAVWRMAVKGADFQDRYTPSSRTYECLRMQFGSLRKGKLTPDFVKEKISIANKGNVAWNKGIPRTAEEKELMSRRRKEVAKIVGVWNEGKHHLPDTIAKLSQKARERKKYTCPHCSKNIAGSNYFRWHGDNCKSKNQ